MNLFAATRIGAACVLGRLLAVGTLLLLIFAAGLVLLLAFCGQPARGQVFYLDLGPEKLSVPERMVRVEQVLDGRAGRPALGLVYAGIKSKQMAVVFRAGMPAELTSWLQRELPPRATDQPVVLCVRRFRLSDVQNSADDVVSAEFAADVYQHLPDGYHFVRAVAAQISTRDADNHRPHAARVALLLGRCLQQLSPASWPAVAQRPARSLAELPGDAPQASTRPAILRAALPRRGVYFNFIQFLLNQPDTTFQLRFDTLTVQQAGWEGTVQLRPRVQSARGERISFDEVWGFSDGRQPFIRQRKIYRPLIRQGDFYTFVGGAPLDKEARNQRARTYFTTGLAGALMTPVDDDTDQPMAYALDLRTGQSAALQGPGQAAVADTAFLYVYRPPGGPPDARPLLLNNREVARLRPGQYIELPCPHFGRIMRLTDGDVGGPALLLIPSASAANYIKLRAGAGPTRWQWMPPGQGEAEVDALDKQAR